MIEALFGCAEAFFRPAQTGLLPQTVPEAEIQDARAASGTMETIAEFAGQRDESAPGPGGPGAYWLGIGKHAPRLWHEGGRAWFGQPFWPFRRRLHSL